MEVSAVPDESWPPAIRTLPLESSVAVWPLRAVARVLPEPVNAVKVPATGSKISALASAPAVVPLLEPATISTVPLLSSVAVAPARVVLSAWPGPLNAAKVPATGS